MEGLAKGRGRHPATSLYRPEQARYLNESSRSSGSSGVGAIVSLVSLVSLVASVVGYTSLHSMAANESFWKQRIFQVLVCLPTPFSYARATIHDFMVTRLLNKFPCFNMSHFATYCFVYLSLCLLQSVFQWLERSSLGASITCRVYGSSGKW